MNLSINKIQQQTRRHFLTRAGQFSLGAIALDALCAKKATGADRDANPFAVQRPHFPAKVKRVIYLHMSGGPPHLDIFDYKPELVKHSGKVSPSPAAHRNSWARREPSPNTGQAASGCRTRCRTSTPWPMRCVSLNQCIPTNLITRLPSSCSTPDLRARDALRWVHG